MEALTTTWARADLRGAWFVNVNLRMAVFDGVNVDGATFIECRLEQASFKCDLRGARIMNCDLRAADLSSSTIAADTIAGAALADDQTQWPAGFSPSNVVETSSAWMARRSIRLSRFIRALRANQPIDLADWLAK